MHIEIPDGVLPPWLWIAGFVVVAICFLISSHFAKKKKEKLPLAALLSGLSLLVMSVPLGLPVHINLMVVVGIIVGPFWALVVSLVVNSLLASVGHGGVTVIGLNTLLLWSQAVFGFLLFKAAKNIIGEKEWLRGISAGVVAFLSLGLSFILLGGLVFAVNLNPEEILVNDHDHNHHDHDDHYHEDDEHGDYHDASLHHGEESHEEHHHIKEDDHHHGYYLEEISLTGFMVVVMPLFLYAAIVESIISGLVISFLGKSRPDLL